jgi:pilus assembly protein TadC
LHGIKAKIGGLLGGSIGLLLGYFLLIGVLYSTHKLNISQNYSIVIIILALCLFQILVIIGMTSGERLFIKKGIKI